MLELRCQLRSIQTYAWLSASTLFPHFSLSGHSHLLFSLERSAPWFQKREESS